MNIVVLAGGLSPERDVSLSTGTMVTNALRKKGHNAILVDLFFGVEQLPTPIATELRLDHDSNDDIFRPGTDSEGDVLRVERSSRQTFC